MSCLLTFQWAMGIIKSYLSSKGPTLPHTSGRKEGRRIVWPGVLVIPTCPALTIQRKLRNPNVLRLYF